MSLKPWNDFPPNDRSQWEEIARQELQGESPFEKLKRSKEKINILPYYDRNDRIGKNIFSLPPSNHPFLGARAWHNISRVAVADELQANKQALLHLSLGAEGIQFELPATSVDVARLLKNIQLPYCLTIFSGDVSEEFKDDFASYASAQFDTSSINGLFIHQSLADPNSVFTRFSKWNSFRSLGFWAIELESAVDTIARILRHVVFIVDQLTENGQTANTALRQIGIGISIGPDFFHEIARLRALRALLKLVCVAYRVSDVNIPIHTRSSRWEKESFQPHSNLIKSTTSGLAAILGGCDSLIIEPEETGRSQTERMARNLSLLFREESHLTQVADPVGGSYYVEKLTNDMAEKSWALFQTSVNS